MDRHCLAGLKRVTKTDPDGVQALIATGQTGIGDMIKHNR
jgi:hypothetical protein